MASIIITSTWLYTTLLNQHKVANVLYIWYLFITNTEMQYNIMFINRSVVTLPNLSMFTFQQNEISVQVQVALLAFSHHDNISVTLSLEIELWVKKIGPAYHPDHVIINEQSELSSTDAKNLFTGADARNISNSTDARGSCMGTGMLVYQLKTPVMVIVVKTVVPIEFEMVEASDCIEMLIYCLYILRSLDLNSIIGCVTDAKVWHAIRVSRNDTDLCINKIHDICKCWW